MKPWLAHYDSDVRPSLAPYPEKTLVDYLDQLARGDRVAVLLPNCPQFFVAEFGAWKIGAVVVGVNPTYSERELEQVLHSTRAETVIAMTPFYPRVKQVQARAGKQRLAVSLLQQLPAH